MLFIVASKYLCFRGSRWACLLPQRPGFAINALPPQTRLLQLKSWCNVAWTDGWTNGVLLINQSCID